MNKRLLRPPEILQTSEMDCGPAALASLLGSFGLTADLGALRDACATDVDGTSIDALEEVAVALGLEAEQLVVPWEQVRAVPERYLPALLVTRTPAGFPHVVCAWRARHGRLELVDPAVGRRRVRWQALADEVYQHELDGPLSAWNEYAASDDAREALIARLRRAGMSHRAALDEVAAARRDGGIEGVGALLNRLRTPESEAVVAPVAGCPELVHVRGVILVRAQALAICREPTKQSRRLLGSPAPNLWQALWALAVRHPVLLAFVGTATALAASASISELLAARRVLQDGDGQLGWLLSAVAAAMVATSVSAGLVAALGRRIERDVLTRLVGRIVRLGEAYTRTRPAGDLAERTHAVRLIREVISVAGLGMQRVTEVLLACAAMVLVAPATWPAAIALACLGVTAPQVVVRALREADLRTRALGGALAQLLTDTLGGLGAVRAHRGASVILSWQAPLLAAWTRAANSLAARTAASSIALTGPGLLLVAAAVGLGAAAEADAPSALVVAALAFTAAGGIADATVAARRLASLRSVLARLLDPLRAPLLDPEPVGAGARRTRGAEVHLHGVDVTLGGSPVLTELDVVIQPGEHVAIVGVSGAGKSCFLGLIGGWLVPTSGRIEVDRRPLVGRHLAEVRAATAWSDPQARLRDVGVEQNAQDGASSDARPAAVRLGEVGLSHLDRVRSVGEAGDRLTQSERQRLRLARALGRPNARLVLLDEALRDLPQHDRANLLAHARGVWRDATLLHVTHDPNEAADFDRVLVFADGRVSEDGVPDHLSRRADSRLRGLIEAQSALDRRLADASRWTAAAPRPSGAYSRRTVTDSSGARQRVWSGLLSRNAVLSGLCSVACALVATVALVATADQLGDGLGSPDAATLNWLPVVIALLIVTSAVSGLGRFADGRLSVSVGRALRRRALVAAVNDDPRRHRGEGTGARLGRVLDLEAIERSAQGVGTMFAVGCAQIVAAGAVLVHTGSPASAAVLTIGLTSAMAMAMVTAASATRVNAVRRSASARLLDLLLGMRAATIYADPEVQRAEQAAAIQELEVAERRHDRARIVLLAVLPRTTTLATLAVLTAAAPDRPDALAATLGAALLALFGLERATTALAELAGARAAWRGAHGLLRCDRAVGRAQLADRRLSRTGPAPNTPSGPRSAAQRHILLHLEGDRAGIDPDAECGAAFRVDGDEGTRGPPRVAHVPPPGRDVFFHQPLVANAVLATGTWPPGPDEWDGLERLLAELGLRELVERMPCGLAQPLGETGWRLSEGERARFSLLRALFSRPSHLLAGDILAALDPHTAHVVLDHLEAHPASIILVRSTRIKTAAAASLTESPSLTKESP